MSEERPRRKKKLDLLVGAAIGSLASVPYEIDHFGLSANISSETMLYGLLGVIGLAGLGALGGFIWGIRRKRPGK